MRLVLRGFSQDVDLIDPEKAESYLIFEFEGTDELVRVQVPADTIHELTTLIHSYPGVREEPEKQEELEEVEAAPEEVEETPVPTVRKRIVSAPLPHRRPIPRPPPLESEDQVPSV